MHLTFWDTRGPFSHQWLTLKSTSLVGFMLVVMATAIGTVYVKHKNRLLHTELHQLDMQRDRLQVEWSQLILEHSTLTSDVRVEYLAKSRLAMNYPGAFKVIKP